MDNERPKIELMNSLLMSLPGTPIIYYGDEIGMGDNIYLGDRNGVTRSMAAAAASSFWSGMFGDCSERPGEGDWT
jgi:glycosidase